MYTPLPYKENELMAFSKAGTPKASGVTITNNPADPPSPNTIMTSEAAAAALQKALDALKTSMDGAYQPIPAPGTFTPGTLTTFDPTGKITSTGAKIDNNSPPTANVLYDSLKIDQMIGASIAASNAAASKVTTMGNFMKVNGSSQVIPGGAIGTVVSLPTVDSFYGTAVTSAGGGLKLLGGNLYHIMCSLNMAKISSINYWVEFSLNITGSYSGATNKKLNLVPFSWMGEVLHENAQADFFISCTTDCTVTLSVTGGSTDATLTGTLEPSSYLSAVCTGVISTP